MKTLRKTLDIASKLVEAGQDDKAAAEIRPQAGKIIRISERQELRELVDMLREACERETANV